MSRRFFEQLLGSATKRREEEHGQTTFTRLMLKNKRVSVSNWHSEAILHTHLQSTPQLVSETWKGGRQWGKRKVIIIFITPGLARWFSRQRCCQAGGHWDPHKGNKLTPSSCLHTHSPWHTCMHTYTHTRQISHKIYPSLNPSKHVIFNISYREISLQNDFQWLCNPISDISGSVSLCDQYSNAQMLC